MKKLSCKNCNKTFIHKTKTGIQKYCSNKCLREIRNLKKRLKRLVNIKIIKSKCPECKKQFKQKSNQNKKFCNSKCCDKYHGRKFSIRRLKKLKTDAEYRKKFYDVRNAWTNKNKEKIKVYRKKAQEKPQYKIKRNKYLKEYYKDPKNYERRKELRAIRYWQKGVREKKLEYKKLNREKIRIQAKQYSKRPEVKKRTSQYRKNKFKTDPIWVLRARVRTRFYTYVKRGLAKKKVKTLDLIGCDWAYLKKHLEKQFKSNMNWDNFGKWHIDHIKPMSYFNLFDLKEQKKCFHYSNLQPLWATENLSKGNRYIG